ncbi:hypothetical protein V8017_16220 [Stenotrophomonas rhizophila]
MSRSVDVLAVLDSAKRVAALCDPLVRSAQHPASNSLEAQAFNLRGEIDAARAAVAALIEAVETYAASEAALVNRELAGINAEPHEKLQRRVHSAREELDIALARVRGAA